MAKKEEPQPTAEELAAAVAAKAEAEAAAAEAERLKAEDALLVSMSKDGEIVKVHPGCVADHQRCGWKVTA